MLLVRCWSARRPLCVPSEKLSVGVRPDHPEAEREHLHPAADDAAEIRINARRVPPAIGDPAIYRLDESVGRLLLREMWRMFFEIAKEHQRLDLPHQARPTEANNLSAELSDVDD